MRLGKSRGGAAGKVVALEKLHRSVVTRFLRQCILGSLHAPEASKTPTRGSSEPHTVSGYRNRELVPLAKL